MHQSEVEGSDAHGAAGRLLDLLAQQEGAEAAKGLRFQGVLAQIQFAGAWENRARGAQEQLLEGLLGVDTCPIEGFTPAEYDRILALEGTPYRTCVVCAAGYRAADDKYATLAKVRYPAEELIEWR